MAKRRSRNRRRQQREQNNAACDQHHQNPNEENRNNPDGVIVLGTYIHCEGCGNQVLKCLRGFQGVEGIEIDDKNHKVIVKGKRADPIKVSERLRKKSGKHVELISPKPVIEEIKEEKKPEPQVIEVVLKIYLHCEGCAKDVKHCIHDMEGKIVCLSAMDISFVKERDPVNAMDAEKENAAEIVKQSNPKGSNDRESEGNKKETQGECCVVHNYPTDRLVYAPQLFSDENPNSCSVM
ncbi:UNVERIFIED_CONTAM: Heavy metal-associated isoprenylated plant protein 7 [Sesamum radiatum]|uniref:Heavy metal-associated isoprenylated plant protein 7 n=1 Tax=Sesamum radiatum TaxID=300843 RepID=A0AAW2MWK4_SESRA